MNQLPRAETNAQARILTNGMVLKLWQQVN